MWVSWSDVGAVDPESNPVNLESGGSGQDHDVGSLLVWLKCLVLVSPDVHPVTWMVAVRFWRGSGLIKSFQLRPDQPLALRVGGPGGLWDSRQAPKCYAQSHEPRRPPRSQHQCKSKEPLFRPAGTQSLICTREREREFQKHKGFMGL